MPFDSEAPVEVTTRDRLIRLRDHFAQLSPRAFAMHEWDCGTTACIGGWISRLFDPMAMTCREAGELIGISEIQADALFIFLGDHSYHSIKTEHVVRVLDHLLETGEVDWDVAFA